MAAMQELPTEIELFDHEPEKAGFEQMVRENGFLYWWASDLATMLGYESLATFHKVINKAMVVCHSLGIDQVENFAAQHRIVDGKQTTDYKLSRFACYLAAMNGDVKKPQVAKAQAYFAAMAVALQAYADQVEGIDRVSIRSELSDREKSLSGVAKAAGVTEYPFFQNAGYRGLYNMNLSDLRRLKGVPQKRSPLDFMGREELAANLFRITQTELKIKNEGIRGQSRAETAAEHVGREVRNTMIRVSNTRPEDLPAAHDLQEVKASLKQAQRHMKKLDKKS
jgi:DNA-damage-inducible protein D